MKTLRSKKGPFSERPFFEEGEIEILCLDELRRHGFLRPTPGPTKIDSFIEKRFGVTHDYVDLPSGVLGLTEFSSRGVEGIFVSRTLDQDDSVSERHVSSTLAHECGHGLLHAHLFAFQDSDLSLFQNDQDVERQKILCRDAIDDRATNAARGYNGKWWEFQANKAMGALLLPKPLVMMALESYTERMGALGAVALPDSNRLNAERVIAELFEVNRIVAKIRLDGIFKQESVNQLTL